MHAKTTIHTITHTFFSRTACYISWLQYIWAEMSEWLQCFLDWHIKDKNLSFDISQTANSQLKSQSLQERSCFLNGLALLVIPDQVFRCSNGQGCTGKCGTDVSHVREIVFIANTRAQENVNPFGWKDPCRPPEAGRLWVRFMRVTLTSNYVFKWTGSILWAISKSHTLSL